ncbi:MAG TPA: hypothetical protein VIU12_29705 [Chryseolinea sp.]
MNNRWRNRITFWLLCLIPFGLVFLLGRYFGPTWFGVSLMFYAAIYRPILAIFRLQQLGLVERKDTWKAFIPFYYTSYTVDLWVG